MTTYTANLSEDQINFLVDGTLASVADHITAEGFRFDNTAAQILRDLPGDVDGHYDGEAIWISGTDYPVTQVAA